ncbi:MAG TPA: protein kinase [Gemmataceae bacterium]|nr:protein kinase [Gemmataceae bacterium]
MTISSPVLLEALREYRLLEEEQLNRLALEVRAHALDAEPLATELRRRGLLTAFQAEQLLAGRAADLVLGTKYVLLDKLGEGGMGAVYKARHRITRGVRAVKLIRSEYLTSKDAVQRFFLEAQAAEKLNHPNIIRAYDADQDQGRCYFVMEYVEGEDLAKLLSERGQLPVAQACEYVRQAALGLQHASERGLVHRDIKPSNLLLSPAEGVIKILDLGLARLRESSAPGGDEFNPLTPMNMMMGTPDFMAPEQAEDSRAVDIRADIYALGGTLYQLLSGSVPFPGGTLVDKLKRLYHEMPAALPCWRNDIPPGLSAVVERMMAKRPDQRYQTPAEVAVALQPFCSAILPSLGRETHTDAVGNKLPTVSFPESTAPQAAPQKGSSVTALNVHGELFSLPQKREPAGPPAGRGPPARAGRERAQPSRRRLVVPAALVAAILVPPLIWWLMGLGSGSGTDEGGGMEDPDRRGEAVVGGPDRPPGNTDKKSLSRGTVSPPDQTNPVPVKRGVGRPAVAGGTPVAAARSGTLASVAGKGIDWERSPEEVRKLGGDIEHVVFSANGSQAAAPRRLQIELYALGEKPRTMALSSAEVAGDQVKLDPALGELALSPDGTRGAFATTGMTDARVRGSAQFITSLDLLVEWGGSEPRLFFGPVAAEITEVQGRKMPASSARCLAYTGDGKKLLEGTTTEFRSWEIKPDRSFYDRYVSAPLKSPAESLAGSPGGRYAAVGLRDGTLRLFRLDAADSVEPAVLKGHASAVRSVAFLAERRLVSGDSDGTVCMWRLPEQLKEGEEIQPVHKAERWHADVIRSMAAAPGGEQFATGADGLICLGRFGETRPLWQQKCDGEVRAVAFSADGRSLYFATKKVINRIPLRGDTSQGKFRPATTDTPGIGKS